jgi:uncharacterized lipoprotein YddW (UPF0748 family)
MQRRDFLGRVGAAAAGAAILPFVPAPAVRVWTWVHGDGDLSLVEWRRRFARIRAAGITGVLVGGGEVQLLGEAAHSEGLTFHRWTWILNRTGDAWAKEHHPEWFIVSRQGDSSLTTPPYVGYYQWVCPNRAPVREYLRGLVAQIAREPGVDAVHFDYIRFPDVILPVGLWAKYGLVQDHEFPEYDFCYCDVCRGRFAEQSGRDPLDLPDPPADEAWRRFRWDSLTGLVRELADAVHAQGREVSAAVFPTPALARRLVRQAWEQWPLDAVFPMLYHAFYQEPVSWIGTAAEQGVAALPPGRPLYAGLYLPDLTPADLADAIRSARDGGASGVSLFEMGGLTDGHLMALGKVGL